MFHEPERHLAAARRLEIDGEAAFVPVAAEEQHAVPLAPRVRAAPVALPRAFDVLNGDHVGTEIAQELDAHRAKEEMVETDDANTPQQVEHAQSFIPADDVAPVAAEPQARSRLIPA